EPLLAPVMVNHGEQKEMEVAMVRVGYGLLRIDSNAPEVKVRIDEQPKGVWKAGTEPLDVQSPSGPHKLTVLSDGRKTFEGMIDVPRGQVLPVHVKMIPRYPRGAAWTQAIIGAAVIGTAAYFGNESNKIYDQLDEDRKSGRLESGDSRATKGRWFAVGGVLGILATYNFIKDPLPPSSVRSDKPVEFDDPRKSQPVALRAPLGPQQQRLRLARPEPALPPPSISVGKVGVDAQGVMIGGTF
ncbi:MAG TPA: PEGA domain-containing protein, partial [Polyangiaceae bacterium]|nr:PEGA domain-containing protein [Polyangiaceae bacterium]